MPKIDVVSEAVIDSPPMAVYKALLDEVSGVTQWWIPDMAFKIRGDTPIDHEGAIYDATINPTSRMNAKLTKTVEAKLIEEEIAGCFTGTAGWTFEPTDGKTKVQVRFNVKTNGILLSLFSPFVDYGKNHRDVMEKRFKALNSYLSKK